MSAISHVLTLQEPPRPASPAAAGLIMTSDGQPKGQGRSFEETLSDQSKGSEAVAVQRADSGQGSPSDPKISEIQTLATALPTDLTQIPEADHARPGTGNLFEPGAADFTVMPPETRSRPTVFEGPLLSDPATHVRPILSQVDGSRPTNPIAGFSMLQVANTTGDNRIDMSVLTDVSTVKRPQSPSLSVPAPVPLTVATTSLTDAIIVGETQAPTSATNLTIANAPALPTPLAIPATDQAATDADLLAPKAEGNIAFSTVKTPHSPSLSAPTATDSLPQTLPIATPSLTSATVDGGTLVAAPTANVIKADVPALPTRLATPSTATETMTPGPKVGAHTDITAADLSYRPGQRFPTSTAPLPQTLTVAAASQSEPTIEARTMMPTPDTPAINIDALDLPSRPATPIVANPAVIADAPGPKVEANTVLTTVKTPYSASVPTAASIEFPPQALTVTTPSPTVATIDGDTLALVPETTAIKADAPGFPINPGTLTAVQAVADADTPAPKVEAPKDVSTVKLQQSLSAPVTSSSEPLPQTLSVTNTSPTPATSAKVDGGTSAPTPVPAANVIKTDAPALPTPPATPTTAQAAANTDVPAPKAEAKADNADRPTLSTRAAETADYRALAQSSSRPAESSMKIADAPSLATPFLTNSDAPVAPKSLPVMTALPTLAPLSGMSDRLAATIMQTTQAQPIVTLDKLPQTVVAIALSAKSATLQIDPPELGRIQLDYQFDSQGRTVVTLTPESDAARAALMDRMASIIAALEQGSDKPIDVQLGDARDFGSEFDQTSQDDRGSGSNTKDGANIAASDNAPSHEQQRFMRAPLGEAERLHILV